MTDIKDKAKKKKTLSLKLGVKPIITPKRNIEAGKTVIVEKKRYKRGINSENESQTQATKKQNPVEKSPDENNEKIPNKSGVVLKPLTKDEQKRILKADNKKEKKDEIDKIRSGKLPKHLEKQNSPLIENKNINVDNLDNRDYKKDSDKKKNSEQLNESEDRKKPQNTYGRKKIRERKVTIVTALSDIDERTRSLAAYKRAKQKTKKTNIEQEPAKKIVRDVYIPEFITVKELANRMTERSFTCNFLAETSTRRLLGSW